MQNYMTAIVDLSGTKAALMMKLKNIDCYADDIDIDEIKKKYNIMDVFTNYKVTSEELLFQQTVDMIARGIELTLSVREHICRIEK